MGGVLSADDLRQVQSARTLPAGRDAVAQRIRCKQPARSPPRRPRSRCVAADGRCSIAGPDPTPNGTWRSPARSEGPTRDGSQRSGDAEPQAAESCTTHISASCDEEGTMVAITTTLLSSDGKPRGAAEHRHPHEQRSDVVRPASRPAKLDCAGQEAAHQHVSGHSAPTATSRGS